MNKIIGIISLLVLSLSNAIAGAIPYKNLNNEEKNLINENFDNDLIKYDSNTDEIVFDEELETYLRAKGLLQTESITKTVLSKGGGGAWF